MPDLGTMVSKILTDLNRGSQHAPRAKQAIADAIEYFKTKRLGFNQNRMEAAITRGTEILELPPEWIEVDFVRLQDGTERVPITEKGYAWIEDNLRDNTYYGRPQHFAIQNRELRLYPITDASYSLMMIFQCEFPEVSASAADTTSNVWTNEGELLVRTYAQGEMMVNYIQGDAVTGGAALMSFALDTLLNKYESRAAREQGAGKIRGHM